MDTYIIRDPAHTMSTLIHILDNQGLTRKQFANETPGISPSQVTEWFNGKHEPGISKLFTLIHGLGYDIALIPHNKEEHP